MPVNRIRNRSRDSERGYVMLVVLAVFLLVITSLGTLAQLSLRKGLAAADAERALQQRWGALSLERVLLPRASQVFQDREERVAEQTRGRASFGFNAPSLTHLRDVITINGVTFDLLLGDEDAKLNLNTMYHYGGPGQTLRAVEQILGQRIAVELRPAVRPLLIAREQPRLLRDNDADADTVDGPTVVPPAFRSWGEVFQLAAGNGRVRSSLPAMTTGMTCWGTGQLNLRRASDQAILAVAADVVQDGAARRLLQRFRRNPTASLDVLLQTEVSNQRDRQQLRQRLSEVSTSFSIWIDASNAQQRSYRRFTTMQRDEEGVIRQQTFLD